MITILKQYFLPIAIGLSLSGCLTLNQGAQKNTSDDFAKKLKNTQQAFSMGGNKKLYETNKIYSNDFPVTYRSKLKKSMF